MFQFGGLGALFWGLTPVATGLHWWIEVQITFIKINYFTNLSRPKEVSLRLSYKCHSKIFLGKVKRLVSLLKKHAKSKMDMLQYLFAFLFFCRKICRNVQCFYSGSHTSNISLESVVGPKIWGPRQKFWRGSFYKSSHSGYFKNHS